MLWIWESKKDIFLQALIIILLLGGNYFLNIDLSSYITDITELKVLLQNCAIFVNNLLLKNLNIAPIDLWMDRNGSFSNQ